MAATASVIHKLADKDKSFFGPPTAKVAVGGLAGAVTLIVLELVTHYFKTTPSAEVGAAVTTVITFLVQYITPERR